jgi:hypothetical protein
MSWIQRHALLILLRSKSARIKDLTPSDVAANAFSYHMGGLVTAGLVEKTARGTYSLTSKGEILAGSYSTETGSLVKEIKTVIMFYGKKDDRYLLFRWSRQPYLNRVTLPYDRLPFGQSLNDGIDKAMRDKLGAQFDATYKTNVIVKIQHRETIVSHMNALVYEVDVNKISLPFKSRNGELILGQVGSEDGMDGMNELIQAIETTAHPSETQLSY